MNSLPPSPAEREKQLRLVRARAQPKNQAKAPDRWPIFLEVVVGGVAWCTREDLIGRLKNRDRLRNTEAEQVEKAIRCPGFKITTGRQDLKLALATPKELGLHDGGFLRDIYKKAAGFDLVLLPVDTGPLTILQVHTNWTKHGSIVIASEPVVIEDGRKLLFDVSNSRLRVLTGESDHYWGPTQPFLFRRL